MEETQNKSQFVVVNFSDPSRLLPENPIDTTPKNYVPFGADNLFPQAIALLSRTSPNHRGIINSKVNYIQGKGIADDGEIDLYKRANAEGHSLMKVLRRAILDDQISGNAWIEIITDRRRSFMYYNHLDFTKVRKMKDTPMVIVHPDWAQDKGVADKYRTYLPLYPNFLPDKDNKQIYRSVYHLMQYEPEFVNYGIPLWIAGRDAATIDFKTSRWNLSRLENSFRVSGILVVPVTDQAEGQKVIKNIKENFTGQNNQAKLLTITKTRARENEKADTTQLIETKQDDDGSWINLHTQSQTDVIVSHGWFRSLAGIPDNTGFDTRRILNEYSLALDMVIKPKQEQISEFIRETHAFVLGREVEVTWQNKPPVTDYMFHRIHEVRELLGLESDENAPDEQVLYLGQSNPLSPSQNTADPNTDPGKPNKDDKQLDPDNPNPDKKKKDGTDK
jgi:hypothetical protein